MFGRKKEPQTVVEKTIELKVYDKAIDMSCFSGGWGPSWSQAEIVAMVDDEIQRRYPQAVINYFDIKDDPSLLPADIAAEVESKGLFWPITVLNGLIKYDGMMTLPKAIAIIEEEQDRLDRLNGAPESDWKREE